MDPLHSDAPLIVYVDIKSPYAFVAIEPILALEAQIYAARGARFDWRPLTLDIPSYLGSARKSDSGELVENKRSASQWGAVKYAYMDARRYAERQGHTLRGTQKIWNSAIANIGILWCMAHARERLADYLRAVYPPFWRRELDIEDPAVVAGVLARAGADTDGFIDYQAGEGRDLHDALQARLHPAGIYGVPTFVFDDQCLFGREHLPYVRWALSGRRGAAPDVAYEI